VKQISEEVLYARRAGASHTVSGELANLDNLKECNCSALAHRVGELEKRNEELENKKVDLYEILLDSFIEILKQHGVTEVCILNEFTRSIENQCQQALPPLLTRKRCVGVVVGEYTMT